VTGGTVAMRRTLLLIACLSLGLVGPVVSQTVTTGTDPGAVRFAVIGDAGTGQRPQYEIADRLWAARAAFDFDLVLLLGDNMYGSQHSSDFVDKFERPYQAFLEAGVRFFATLGNHDKPSNRDYPGFNMGGARYYTFVRQHVRFVVLDSNRFDPEQARWAEDTLARATEPWKIVYFHHPLYSDGKRHGSDVELRVAIEPLLLNAGVRVVFNGHEHFYERTTPQKGITYFIAGSGGQLRKGGVQRSPMTGAAFDEDQAFMLVEVGAERLHFQTISRTGVTVDSGAIDRRPTS
jgi:hypothetical protein